MKIALTCIGKEMNDNLDLRFGRCSYFLIFDSSKGVSHTLENKGQSSDGGAGIAAAQQIIDEDVEIVITGSLGPYAYNLMLSSGIKVYASKELPCSQALELFSKGELEEITQAGPSHMGMGSGK